MFVFKFLLAIVLTESITEIVTKSEIFRPFRAKIFNLGQRYKIFDWFHRLLDCGYCFSVWSGVFIAFLFFKETNLGFGALDLIVLGLVFHRLANLFHNFIDKIHGT